MPEANELVEVSAGELAALRNAKGLLETLWGNKETGTAFKRMVKKVNPQAKIPDLELAEEFAEPINKELGTLKEQNAALLKRLDERDAKDKDERDLRDIHAKIDDVARKRGLTDEGKAGLIKTMQDRQIADPDAAALLYLDSLPKAAPIKGHAALPQRMNLFGVNTPEKQDEQIDKLFKDPQGFMDDEIANVLNEAAA